MADRKSGPVKPPVIDLKAREAETQPAARKSSAAPTEARSEHPKKDARQHTAEPVPKAAAEQATAPAHVSEPPSTPSPEPEPQPERHRGPEAPRHTEASHTGAAARPAATLPPRPPARLAMPWSAISLAALIGAALGTLLTYAMVNVLPIPNSGPHFPDPTPRLDAATTSIDTLTASVTDLEAQTRKTQVSLDATIAQLDSAVTELKQSIAAVPSPQPVDLTPIETQIKTLEDRISAVGAGASSADAEALAKTISDLQSGISDVKASVDQLGQQVSGNDGRVAALTSELDAAKKAITAQNQTLGGAEVSPAVRLPLVVSGLETAFANGRPYDPELKSLTTLLPDLKVPGAVADGAATGLPRPDLVAARFTDAVPAILGARTGTGTGDWTQDAMNWVKAMLALRPTGEVEGDSPDAVVSRLEGAVGRRDFPAAADLLSELPQPMQVAAGDVGKDIANLAAAEDFLSALRAQALAPPETVQAPQAPAPAAGTAQ